jgi:diadenosine tetraphosphate (Ap4A) HIT family hydrolase
MVRQMHIHVLGRSSDDPAWPGTVWAYEGKSTYAPEVVEAIRVAAREYLGLE